MLKIRYHAVSLSHGTFLRLITTSATDMKEPQAIFRVEVQSATQDSPLLSADGALCILPFARNVCATPSSKNFASESFHEIAVMFGNGRVYDSKM